ncbi:hypothetical protein BIU87_28225 [Streptomyces sp. ZS0098]|nr:hypothetical protein BIU87_28225 [Streptomyces sp. ZS0098]
MDEEREGRVAENAAWAAVRATRAGEGARRRTDLVRWLFFHLVCAGGSLGIAWLGPVLALPAPVRGVGMALALLVLPLATVLVPVLLLRRVPRRKRKVAWQLLVPLVAGAAVGMLGHAAGEQAALAERGQWVDAVVVSMDDSGTNHCDLRMTDGRAISPSLSEGDGCENWVTKGDEMRVQYDPESIASPTKRSSQLVGEGVDSRWQACCGDG